MRMSLEEIVNFLEYKATLVRKNIIEMIYNAGSGHPGGSLSCADVLTLLYFYVMRYDKNDPKNENRDRFVLSKGHAAPTLYSVLYEAGCIQKEELKTFRKINSRLQGHPSSALFEWVEISTGSLGQGLSVANGIAIAGKLDEMPYKVYCLVGDGEVQEGNIWEAAMTSSHYKLDNLCLILDHNRLQIDGKVSDVKNIEPIEDKFRAFGWETIVVDGHNFYKLIKAFEKETNKKPKVIIAQTVKGKGISFMENEIDWHGKAPNKEQRDIAIKELDAKLSSLEKKKKIKLKPKTPKKVKLKLINKSYTLPKFEKGEIVRTRDAYGMTLRALGEAFPNIVVLDADLAKSTKSIKFKLKYPERFFDIGIAEQDLIGTAAGLATCGKKVFASTFAVFVGRAYDQIRNCIAYSQTNVVIAGSHGGLITGEDGASHIALEDITLMRTLPNMVVINPCDAVEMVKAIEAILNYNGPVYIRMYRPGLPVIHDNNYEFRIGKGEVIINGKDVTLISTGDMVYKSIEASKKLKEEGIDVRVINMPTIKPIDKNLIKRAAKETNAVITVEDHTVNGGFGDAVRDHIPPDVLFCKIGVSDTFASSGKPEELLNYYQLNTEHIIKKVKEILDLTL